MKRFFQVVGPKHGFVQVKCLKKRDGEVSFDPIEMRAIATEFYETLTCEDNDISINSRERVWNSVPTRVTSNINNVMMQPFSSKELLIIVKELTISVCPEQMD
jgi:hypothetical protein